MSETFNTDKPAALRSVNDLCLLGATVISPEGMEETVVKAIQVFVTLTQGGKFRLYGIGDKSAYSLSVQDTKEEASKFLGRALMLHGVILSDPEKGVSTILDSMKKHR